MRFWFPIGAAAVCSYLGNRFGSRLRARYAPPALAPGTRSADL
jgi:hypothetical protein